MPPTKQSRRRKQRAPSFRAATELRPVQVRSDQLDRATLSVPLNVAEGGPKQPA